MEVAGASADVATLYAELIRLLASAKAMAMRGAFDEELASALRDATALVEAIASGPRGMPPAEAGTVEFLSSVREALDAIRSMLPQSLQ